MENKFNESTPQRPDGNRIMDASLVSIDLNHYKKMIREEDKWKEGARNAITIYKSSEVRILMIALHANGDLPRHSANGTICVQVLEGKMNFSTPDRTAELSEGEMIVLHKNIPHSVTAIEETVFLLTVSM